MILERKAGQVPGGMTGSQFEAQRLAVAELPVKSLLGEQSPRGPALLRMRTCPPAGSEPSEALLEGLS